MVQKDAQAHNERPEIDTALLYGVGKIEKQLGEIGVQDPSWVIATKVSHRQHSFSCRIREYFNLTENRKANPWGKNTLCSKGLVVQLRLLQPFNYNHP